MNIIIIKKIIIIIMNIIIIINIIIINIIIMNIIIIIIIIKCHLVVIVVVLIIKCHLGGTTSGEDYTTICGQPRPTIFFHIFSQTARFLVKTNIERKMCFDFL